MVETTFCYKKLTIVILVLAWFLRLGFNEKLALKADLVLIS